LKPARCNKICIVLSTAPGGKKYHIPRWLAVGLLSFVVGLAAAGAGGLYYAFSLTKTYTWQASELERLQEENQKQQFQIQGFARKISLLDDQMERFEDFHARFKMLAEKDLKADRPLPKNGLDPLSVAARETSSSIFPEKALLREAEEMYLELEDLRTNSLRHTKNLYRIEDLLGLDKPLTLPEPAISTPTLGFRALWPTIGLIMSHFGKRLSPVTGQWQTHTGIDISTRIGTPVRSTADGVVVFKGWDGAYGNTVILDHGGGYISRYAHLSHIYVSHGQTVHRGDIIGTVGVTGNATGPHLHFEINRNGRAMNPIKFLKLKD